MPSGCDRDPRGCFKPFAVEPPLLREVSLALWEFACKRWCGWKCPIACRHAPTGVPEGCVLQERWFAMPSVCDRDPRGCLKPFAVEPPLLREVRLALWEFACKRWCGWKSPIACRHAPTGVSEGSVLQERWFAMPSGCDRDVGCSSFPQGQLHHSGADLLLEISSSLWGMGGQGSNP